MGAGPPCVSTRPQNCVIAVNYLLSVERMVFLSPVNYAQSAAIHREQTQFKHVFNQTRIGANPVVVGHTEFCGHGCSSFDGRRRRPFTLPTPP
jgi:hypothetical protein